MVIKYNITQKVSLFKRKLFYIVQSKKENQFTVAKRDNLIKEYKSWSKQFIGFKFELYFLFFYCWFGMFVQKLIVQNVVMQI